MNNHFPLLLICAQNRYSLSGLEEDKAELWGHYMCNRKKLLQLIYGENLQVFWDCYGSDYVIGSQDGSNMIDGINCIRDSVLDKKLKRLLRIMNLTCEEWQSVPNNG